MVYRWHAGKLQIHFTFYHRLLVFISWWLRWQRICLQRRRSLGWEDPWQRDWLSTPVFLLGEFHGQWSLVGYSPRGWATVQGDSSQRIMGNNWATNTFILRLGKSKKVQDTRNCIPFALRQEVIFIEAINEKDWVWKIGATRDKE